MRDRIAIIGAGGHGKVCAEIAELCGYREIIFLDDMPAGKENVIGTTADLPSYVDNYDVFVAIGNNALRKMVTERVMAQNGTLATLMHPQSVVSKNAVVGVGSVVMAGAVLNPGAVLGMGTIANTCSSVDHDCIIGDYVHIGVAAHLAGAVVIGSETFVGAGVTVINNIAICDNCTIGSGAVVVKDITEVGTYVGVPARKIK